MQNSTDLCRYFDGMDENDLDRFLDRCEDVLLKDRDHGARELACTRVRC